MADLYGSLNNLSDELKKCKKDIVTLQNDKSNNFEITNRLDKIIELLANKQQYTIIGVDPAIPGKDETIISKLSKNMSDIEIIDKEYIPEINIKGESTGISKVKSEKKSNSSINDALEALQKMNEGKNE